MAVSCNDSNERFILMGDVVGATQGEEVTLSYPLLKDGVWYEQTLTTAVDDGCFRFEGELHGLSHARLWFDNMDEVLLFIEPRRVSIRMERDRPYAFEIRGVSIKAEYEEFRKALGEVPQMLYEKNHTLLSANMAWLDAEQKGDAAADSLKQMFYNAVSELRQIRVKEFEGCHRFLSQRLDYTIAPYLLYYLAFNEAVETGELLRLYYGMPSDVREGMLGLLARQQVDITTSDAGGYEGDTAFDFEREDSSGRSVCMSDYLQTGGLLLLDFWASWCGPCIEQAPHVRRLYEQYSARGLKIIGVSTDDDTMAWRSTIDRYGFGIYPQVLSSEPSEHELFFEELADIAARYDVTSIPCFILIDEKGKIVARWQHFDERVSERLDSLLK